MPADRRLTLLSLVATAAMLSVSAGAQAAPRLDPLFSDNAVLQRGQSIRITGRASAGEQVTVEFAGRRAVVRADRSGRWSAELPELPAGGPHRLTALGARGATASAENLMVGDVWLCSGQSNMEWPVKLSLNGESEAEGAKDDQIRVMTIAQKIALTPQDSFAERPAWQVLTPQSAADFSAACYFMARDLRKTVKVPFGLIDSSWGGTRIRPWMDERAARTITDPEEVDLLALHRRDPAAAARRFAEIWGRWWRGRSGDAEGQEPWRNSGRPSWKPFPSVSYWDQWAGTGFADFNGGVWARHRFSLTAAEAKSPAVLSLGVIDDLDQTFVNGLGVGSTYGWAAEREYKLGPGVLRAGANEIVIFVGDSWGAGGFQGPAEKLKLTFGDGRTKPLGSGWEYAIAGGSANDPPRGPWDSHAGVGTIYNAMIAPLGPLSLSGVAWYQGEADVGIDGYDARLAAMMASWRRQFRNPRLPFLVVGLAAFGKPAAAPTASGWAELQDDQRLAASRDRSAMLVPALDVGERDDVHPPNKQEVGRRLALAARSMVYKDSRGLTAPVPVAARRIATGVQVDFSRALRTLSGDRPLGFEVCAQTQDSCRYADARVAGNSVTLAGDGRPATRVRYAWSDFAIVNLYADDLPVPTFELVID